MVWGAWICLLSPLVAACAITLGGTRQSRRAAGYLATTSCFVAFVGAVASFIGLLGRQGGDRQIISTAWTWITGGSYQSGLQILIDPLSVFMMLVVSGVGALIVWYSIGYMDGDDEERRYFAYMALFVFSMLLLVQAGNLLLLLAGWGMVGLSSYLLIGYWHERPSAIAAAKKAFVMNAIGDATMALAFFLLIQKGNSLEFGILGGQFSSTVANLVALGLLGGAVAKSAQIPLHTWLPDAMEGPTPVSALIHAATMVTAGVYLIVRTHAIFEQAPRIADLAAGLGALTLLVAGLIALVQVDIKRVIAYSTMSQIGYMFVGAGVGSYPNAMFHLMTHAFFKALLFMAAGIVIHALLNEQDIRKMGGLRQFAPKTYWAFLFGSLALVGIFPFAGFFSKDSILAAAMAHGGWYGYLLWAAGLIGTLLTGLYTFRLFFIVWWGEPSAFVREHFHALRRDVVGVSMASTVGVLAVLSLIGGWIQFSPWWHPVETWLQTVAEPIVSPESWQEWLSIALSLLLGLSGIAVAWSIYGAKRLAVPRIAWAQRTLEHKFWFDEAYDALFYEPAVFLANLLRRGVEEPIITDSGRDLGDDTRDLGGLVARAQTGLVRTYVLAIASSVAVLAVVFVIVK
ncbi:MAG: NADH-quinone oxidoreductase subunit L [Actinobacteria bacterium 13_1_20CM_4_69_9]|nr:MAG: NADH-quinone oxidoreductase subunit L [Actinobacteria bacterium 13_1_20CM_4_69_9]